MNGKIQVGDKFCGLIDVRMVGKWERFEGIVSTVSESFNMERLEWETYVSIRNPRNGAIVASGKVHLMREVSITPPEERDERVHEYRGKRVVLLAPWKADGWYRTADGNFVRVCRDWNDPSGNLVVEELTEERPVFAQVN